MNPTGRPQQLQPRPGLAVKKGYIDFFTGNWDDDFIETKYANTFAYVHGFDVDGNPADINPYISFDGNIKYLKRGFLKMFFGSSQDGTDVSNTENRENLRRKHLMIITQYKMNKLKSKLFIFCYNVDLTVVTKIIISINFHHGAG